MQAFVYILRAGGELQSSPWAAAFFGKPQNAQRVIDCIFIAEQFVHCRVDNYISAVGKGSVLVDESNPHSIAFSEYSCKFFLGTAVGFALKHFQQLLFILCEFTHVLPQFHLYSMIIPLNASSTERSHFATGIMVFSAAGI